MHKFIVNLVFKIVVSTREGNIVPRSYRRRAKRVVLLSYSFSAAMHSGAALGLGQSRAHPELKGTVTYRERMLLPPLADIRITVLDVTDPVEPKVIVDKLIPSEGRQVPIPFNVPLDPGSIHPRHSYSVSAKILIGGKVWFVTRKAIPVLTNSNPRDVALVLDRSS